LRTLGTRLAVSVAAAAAIACSSAPKPRGPVSPAPIGGHYDVAFQELANDCGPGAMPLRQAELTIHQQGAQVDLSLPSLPILKGTLDGSALVARAKRGPSVLPGHEAELRARGSVDVASLPQILTIVVVLQYFKDRRPYCQQSWKGEGRQLP
jgi:hypothetical protein